MREHFLLLKPTIFSEERTHRTHFAQWIVTLLEEEKYVHVNNVNPSVNNLRQKYAL